MHRGSAFASCVTPMSYFQYFHMTAPDVERKFSYPPTLNLFSAKLDILISINHAKISRETLKGKQYRRTKLCYFYRVYNIY